MHPTILFCILDFSEVLMKHYIQSIIFIGVLACIGIVNVLIPDKPVSTSERRPLTQAATLLTENFEDYFLDQFVFRDQLRGVKSLVDFYVFQKKDIHEIYIEKGHAFQLQNPYNSSSTERFFDYVLELKKLLPKNSRFVVGVIPDKSYYFSKKGYPSFDYDQLITDLQQGIFSQSSDTLTLVDLSKSLDLSDYYHTDLHWKQESLEEVVFQLLDQFDPSKISQKDLELLFNNEKITYPDFYGGYFSRAPLFLAKEDLTYITTPLTQSSTVTIFESMDRPIDYKGVYDTSALGAIDSYNVFLYGPKSVITIDTHQSTHRHLLLFRDSFGSSLAPLLLDYYDTITLIDLRYISPKLALSLIDSVDETTDVLMLYSAQIVNNSLLLKKD
jgi:hypothetical protein